MNPGEQRLSFQGCRSRRDLVAKFRRWIERLARDHERRITTNVLIAIQQCGYELDDDALERVLGHALASNPIEVEAVVAKFEACLDEHCPGLPAETPRPGADGIH